MVHLILAKLGGRGMAIIAAFVAGMAVLVAAYQTGVNAERKRGEAASLLAEIATLKRDIEIQKAATNVARKIADANEVSAATNAEKVRALALEISNRPAADQCGLSRDDARRLRGIR